MLRKAITNAYDQALSNTGRSILSPLRSATLKDGVGKHGVDFSFMYFLDASPGVLTGMKE